MLDRADRPPPSRRARRCIRRTLSHGFANANVALASGEGDQLKLAIGFQRLGGVLRCCRVNVGLP
jgi:hypothetical protein